MTSLAWSSLFAEPESASYRAAAYDIAAAIGDSRLSAVDVGASLLNAYLAQIDGSRERAVDAQALISRALEAIERGTNHNGLHGGIAGVAWLVAHTDALVGRRDDAFFEDVDDALIRFVEARGMEIEYDLISGLVGIGVYFLERLPHPTAYEGLSLIVKVLDERAERTESTLKWRTATNRIPIPLRHIAPDGCFVVGMAHGIPGIIAFLSEVTILGVPGRGKGMLERAVTWTLAQQMPSGRFPSRVIPGVPPTEWRLAWCYGELGVAVSLLAAARALSDSVLERRAVEIGRLASNRRTDSGTMDACICHGSAGHGHLFNRLFQATGLKDFREAATFWFKHAIEFGIPGQRAGGYQSWQSDSWQADGRFLTGSAGVALAFLAATSSLEPGWDRLLLSRLHPIPVRAVTAGP